MRAVVVLMLPTFRMSTTGRSERLPPRWKLRRKLRSTIVTLGSRVVPRGATSITCVVCVSATVLRPTETVEALLEHLSLDAGASTIEAMLASIATPETEGHRTVADPRQTIGRWRKDLTPELQAVCSEALGPSLQALGYTDDGA